jgi:rhodanese-related sulfurtransferase
MRWPLAPSLLLLLLLLGAGCSRSSEPVAPAASVAIAALTVDEVASRLDAGVKLYDANPRTMYRHAHLPGARWVQFDAVTREVLPDDPATPLVFYCANELCTASPQAARMAVALGYRDVSLMPAGYFGWKAAGKPLEPGLP